MKYDLCVTECFVNIFYVCIIQRMQGAGGGHIGGPCSLAAVSDKTLSNANSCGSDDVGSGQRGRREGGGDRGRNLRDTTIHGPMDLCTMELCTCGMRHAN